MSLEELLCEVRPSTKPVDGGDEKKEAALEKQLGLQLPSDYKQFWRRYGAGNFYDPDRLAVVVWDPFSEHHSDQLASECDFLRDGDEEVPYQVHPEVPGLLPWGSDDNGYGLYWLTEGSPDKWPVLFRSPREYYFEKFELSMTSYLAGCFSQTIRAWCNHTEPIFFSGPQRVRFHPGGQREPAPKAPAAWPATVVRLAEALQASADCNFALQDALLEAGQPELADHFRQAAHSRSCWALELILRPPKRRNVRRPS